MRTPAPAQGIRLGPLKLYAWSVMIGVVAALGAAVFRGLIAFFHNLLFLGIWSLQYDANVHTPASPWGYFVILVPVIGALGVAFLVSKFAPEAKGHGVPEVMDAVYYHNGIVRPVVALVKSLASGLSIGSGGSVGREGPIIQIGASFGSTLGQLLRVPSWQRITLIAAGAGGGIAATFNTPIGGVLFALEIVMHELSVRTLVPVTIATVTAAYGGRLIFGPHPAFTIPILQAPEQHAVNFFVLLLFVILGLLTGLMSVVYIRSIYAFEDFFEKRIIGNYYVRHALGMLAVGVMMQTLFVTTGHYYIEGVGYATVQDVLVGEATWFLLVLCVLKLLAVSLTLGSGASGGVFSPALFMGATLGGVFGLTAQRLLPGLPIQPAAFAVAGMAGVVGGSTGAAITAIVMIFEMTRDYHVVVPMTVTVALSYGIRTMIQPQSIYTVKLARRGHFIPDALQANFYHLQHIEEVMDKQFVIVPANGSVADFVRIASERPEVSCFPVAGAAGLVGFLTRDTALRPAQPGEPETTLADLADRRFVIVDKGLTILQLMRRLHAAGASVAVVMQGAGDADRKVVGLISSQQIAAAMMTGLDLFAD